MEIAPGIHMIQGAVGNRPLQLYLLHGNIRTVLIDVGCAPDPERLIFPYLKTIGLTPNSVDLVVNTHPDLDHCGGNRALKVANPNVLLSCGEADRELIEDSQVMWNRRYNAYAAEHGLQYDKSARQWIFEMLGPNQKVDLTWRGGETLRLGLHWVVELHHTPGHSAGHLSVFDPRSGTMLSGDAVQGAVYLDVNGIPALCPTYIDVDAYLATIAYLEKLPISRLATCHWPMKVGSDISAFLCESRQFAGEAERLLLEELRGRGDSGATLPELIATVGRRLGSWPRSIDPELMYALSGNMARLLARDQVQSSPEERPVHYRLTKQM